MNKPLSLRGPRSVRVEQLVVVETSTGTGEFDNPVRCVTQYWSLDGQLLAVRDHFEQMTLDPDAYWRRDVRAFQA